MIRRFSINFAVVSMLIDAGLISLVLWGAGALRPILADILPVKPVGPDFYLPTVLYVLFPILWVLILMWFSVYDGSKNLHIIDEFSNLTLGAMVAGVALAGILYLTYRDVSRALFLLFFLFSYAGLIAWRLILRPLYRQHKQSKDRIRRVIIAGGGTLGLEVQKRLMDWQEDGLQLIGFLDDDPQKQSALPGFLGTLDNAREVIKESQASDLIIALPLRAYQQVNHLVTMLEDQPLRIWVVPDYFQLSLHRTRIEDFAGLPMLDLRAPALDEYQRLLKRLFDVVVSALWLILALPLMAFMTILIWIFDGRPVLLYQKRAGENGRLFSLYKFRTMIPGAEEMFLQVAQKDTDGNLIHKHKDDPRITSLGRILRRFSLDELPQVYNVLRGEMSLVGPRPELPELVETYQPWQRVRFTVPQGLTGWWQIYGRSDKPMHLHTELDLYYIQHYSFWLDLQILVKTIWVVIRGKGAY